MGRSSMMAGNVGLLRKFGYVLYNFVLGCQFTRPVRPYKLRYALRTIKQKCIKYLEEAHNSKDIQDKKLRAWFAWYARTRLKISLVWQNVVHPFCGGVLRRTRFVGTLTLKITRG